MSLQNVGKRLPRKDLGGRRYYFGGVASSVTAVWLIPVRPDKTVQAQASFVGRLDENGHAVVVWGQAGYENMEVKQYTTQL